MLQFSLHLCETQFAGVHMCNFTRMLLSLAVVTTAVNIASGQQEQGRIIVVSKSTVISQKLSKFLPEWLAPIKYGSGEDIRGLYRIRSDTLTTEKLLKSMKNVPDVLLAMPDTIGWIRQEPETGDPSTQDGEKATAGWFLGSQAYIRVGANVAAPFIVDHPLVTRATICVIGSGLDTSVDVLEVHRPSNGVWGHSLIADPNDLTDVLDHETRVVSQISMVTSADPSIAVYAIKVIHDDGRAYVSDVIKAVQFVIDENMRLGPDRINFKGINLSLSFSGNGTDLAILRDKLYEAFTAVNAFSVMAAGDRTDPESPVSNLDELPSANGLASGARCLSYGFAVAATSVDGSQLSDSSYYGPKTVQIAAPGSANRAVGVGGLVTSFGGTSAAAAIVVGAAVELRLRLGERGVIRFEASHLASNAAGSQSTYGDELRGARLLNFGNYFLDHGPVPSFQPGVVQLAGKMKYFTDQRQLSVSGFTYSSACVQGYFGFIGASAIFEATNTVLSGPPPIANELIVYNKTFGVDRQRVRVK